MGKITQAEIAKQLNISRTTVARALYNRGYVSDELKAEIKNLAEHSGYTPNSLARSLVRKHSLRVLCFLVSYERQFAKQMEDGIRVAEKEFADYGLSAKVYHHTPNNPKGQLTDFENALQSGKADAILMAPMDAASMCEALSRHDKSHLPLAALNLQMPQSDCLYYVGTNDRQSGEIAADMMAKLVGGKGRVLYVSNYGAHRALEDRTLGFAQYLQAYPNIRLHVENNWSDPACHYENTKAALQEMPDLAGICSNTSISGIDKALRDSGRQDIKLIGNDWTEAESTYFKDDSLDCIVCQRPTLQGYLGLKYMAKYLLNGIPPKKKDTYVGFDLITKANYNTEDYFHLL